jgi:ATP-dependent Lhr-like helicase
MPTIVGRWSRLAAPADTAPEDPDVFVEHAARALLRRYGIVARRLLARERWAPPWWALVRVYRRLEARGEIRGGRFVDGCAHEQYALPEAVTALREVRRQRADGTHVVIAATDPLNLVGIIGPGPRVAAKPATRIAYRDGVAVAVRQAAEIRWLTDLEPRLAFELSTALSRASTRASNPQWM